MNKPHLPAAGRSACSAVPNIWKGCFMKYEIGIQKNIVVWVMISAACFSYGEESVEDDVVLFTEFIEEAESLPVVKRQDFVDREFEILRKKLEFPVINKYEAIFVYKGKGKKVELMGDMTNWQVFPISLNKVEGTDLFYLKTHYEEDARLDYKFLVDDTTAILDPLNPKTCEGGFGANSELKMPGYPEHLEVNYYENIAHGEIIEDVIECEAIKDGKKILAERQVKIYLPPNYDETKKYRVLYFKDGSDYIKFGKTKNVLDYMIDKGEIEPTVAVFVDPVDRDDDYVLDKKDVYVDFFVNKLIPRVEENYSVRDDAEGRVLIGPSYGGVIVTYIVFKYPEKFGYILSHSGAFLCAYDEHFGETYGRKISNAPYPVKIFMVVGTYELDLISPNMWFYYDLKKNPSIKAVELRRYPQGHSWGLWRDTLREGLTWLFKEE
jgi:enterochelin esterase family protein